ncbi:MAG: NAD(P)-binding domain-containing protein [Bacilli bacterium]|nr:NAD(P)-binding domain-containing protein [Bacilli bacterium]
MTQLRVKVKKRVTVIGSGAYGCALAHLMEEKGNAHVTIWSHSENDCNKINNEHICPILNVPINEDIECTTSLKDAVEDASYIVMATASNFVKSTCENMKDYFDDDNQRIVLATKGMEGDQVLSKVIQDTLGTNSLVYVISGPAHAEQILKNGNTYLDYYGSEKFKNLIESEKTHLYTSDDPIGIQVGGALKNVLSIGVGILEGSGISSNEIAAFKTLGWREIVQLGSCLGASESTFYGLSGLGDLFTTTDSLDSRNKRCGLALAKGESIEEIKAKMAPATIEGLNAIKSALMIADKYGKLCPVIHGIQAAIVNSMDENKKSNKGNDLVKSLVLFR